MSFSETTNYNLTKPDINSEIDAWGNELNANADTLDALIKGLENRIATLEASNVNVVWQ